MREQMLEEKMRRLMLRLKTAGVKKTGARQNGSRVVAGMLAVGLLMGGAARMLAQATPTGTSLGKIGPSAPVTYDNRYELFGGLNFMNFQAGQDLPKRMNLGGGELLGTYWLTKNLGLAADYRIDAGTTPVLANSYVNNRPLVYMNIGMLGAQYRGPKNQYIAINYHALFGVGAGKFDYSLKDTPPPFRYETGLYSNRVKPMAALGGSIDFNLSKYMAVRLSPDLILEHFGTETREFVAVSGGVVYRFHKKR
jgi:hypothetical protein